MMTHPNPADWSPGEWADLIDWVRNEARELDELCRSMLPGYETFEQEDLEQLKKVRLLIEHLRSKEAADASSDGD